MVESYLKMWKNYANFKDRTTVKDYWFTVLANFLIGFILGFLMGFFKLPFMSPLIGFYILATIIPSLAISIRRLHDINKSGWWLFISLVPLVGSILLLVYYCKPSVTENNNYGTQL